MNIKTILALAAFSIFFVSCGGEKKTDSTKTEDAGTEKVQTTTSDSNVVATTIHITTDEFKRLVMNYEENPSSWQYLGDKPAIIDFWATWCPPCKAIAPVLDDLAKEYAGQIYIYKVDVDKEPQLAGAFGIQSIPTLLFIPMKGDPKAEVGAIPKETFKDRIDNFMLANK
ncbi:MAG: thioredoxin [Paludibacteraceae bacterium]